MNFISSHNLMLLKYLTIVKRKGSKNPKKRARVGVASLSSSGGAGFLVGGFAQKKFEHQSKNTAERNFRIRKVGRSTHGAHGGLKLPRTLRLRGNANHCASDTLAPAASALCVFSLWLRESLVVTQRIWIVLRHKQICMRSPPTYF